MSKFKDISGQKFGRLTALYKLNNYHDKKHTKWLCICECGNLKEANYDHLRNNKTKSCGCYRKEKTKELHSKPSKCYTRLYKTWQNMKDRCYNKNKDSYKNYGSNGIVVCDEWKHNFETFYDWAMDNDYRENLTIDRIDPNGNYEPSNCRWLTIEDQQRNRRNNINFTHNGETHCLTEWCEILDLKYSTVQRRRHKQHLSIEKALGLEVKNP